MPPVGPSHYCRPMQTLGGLHTMSSEHWKMRRGCRRLVLALGLRGLVNLVLIGHM
jgi:hypothetical protein